MSKFSRSSICVVAVVLALLASAPSVAAQAGASTIRGTVSDQQDKVVPGATVTITNEQTNFTRTMKTSSAGTFSFELIPPGTYKVEITADGFRKYVKTGVEALIGSVADTSARLEVGSLSEVVTVEAVSTAVQVNVQDATLGNNFVTQQIIQLPMEARNVQSLLTLQPGVTGSPDASGYVAGARSDQSNITLDGVDINEAQSNSLSSPVLRLSSETIEEFRVTTVNAGANEGRSSAAQINLVTKSGKNRIFGSLFEYHRNTIFTANDFFANRSGTPRPKLIRNTFGGTVGGPVLKDKLFFFYGYEGRTDASETSVVRVVPRAHMGAGQMVVPILTCNTPGCTPSTPQTLTLTTADLDAAWLAVGGGVATNPAAIAVFQAAAAAYPVNDSSQGDGINTGGFRFNSSTPVDLNSNTARIDWNINSKMTAFVRMATYYDLAGRPPQFPDTPAPNLWEHPWGLVASHNWTIANNWVNNFRYGFTRLAFSSQGDSSDNNISFRFVFSPRSFSRTLARTTPVHNIVDDVSYVRGSHTINFGTNIRITRNDRTNLANAFDTAITNPSFYQSTGNVVSTPVRTYIQNNLVPAGTTVALANTPTVQNAGTALIGRYSQYTARFTFGADGSLLSSGTPTIRSFATEEFDFYIQDTWKLMRNLTLTFGIRYGISNPVHERGGFGVITDIPTNEYLRLRIAGAERGVPFNQPLVLSKAGGDGMGSLYRRDKNNWQPAVSVAWSPDFGDGFLGKFLGSGGKSVFRGGFRLTNDYYGQALSVQFDLNNTLGFTSNTTIPANTYNIGPNGPRPSNPAPLFTGFNQQIRPLPGIVVPGPVSFPRQQPSDQRRRIESGLDTELQAPLNYVFNFTYERELPYKLVFQTSYIGRLGRHLLASRDVMALNNLRDPVSGQTWYQAATILEIARQTGAAPNTIPNIPWFQNVLGPTYIANFLAFGYTAANGYATPTNNAQAVYIEAFGTDNTDGWLNDWTDVQDEMELISGVPYFFNPQYGALAAWGTIGKSNYHGMTVSMRQRLLDLTWDFNYTFSHSLDDSSGLQVDAPFGGGFILNPILQEDNYASSDFDLRHQININAVWQLPFGRGKMFGRDVGRGLDAVIGGWQLSGIFRWNTGLPISAPYDDTRWATNWNFQSNVTALGPLSACPTRGDATTPPKLFGCDPTRIYQSFRNAYPGETGMRNVFQLPGYVNLDMGLSKSFTMPWNENQKLQLRWEVFNVTNTQRFGTVDGSRTGFGLQADPALQNILPPVNWSNFTAIQGSPRVMQIGARFEF